MWSQCFFWALLVVPQLLGLDGRTRTAVAAAASEASATSSVSASYSFRQKNGTPRTNQTNEDLGS